MKRGRSGLAEWNGRGGKEEDRKGGMDLKNGMEEEILKKVKRKRGLDLKNRMEEKVRRMRERK